MKTMFEKTIIATDNLETFETDVTFTAALISDKFTDADEDIVATTLSAMHMVPTRGDSALAVINLAEEHNGSYNHAAVELPVLQYGEVFDKAVMETAEDIFLQHEGHSNGSTVMKVTTALNGLSTLLANESRSGGSTVEQIERYAELAYLEAMWLVREEYPTVFKAIHDARAKGVLLMLLVVVHEKRTVVTTLNLGKVWNYE